MAKMRILVPLEKVAEAFSGLLDFATKKGKVVKVYTGTNVKSGMARIQLSNLPRNTGLNLKGVIKENRDNPAEAINRIVEALKTRGYSEADARNLAKALFVNAVHSMRLKETGQAEGIVEVEFPDGTQGVYSQIAARKMEMANKARVVGRVRTAPSKPGITKEQIAEQLGITLPA